MLLIIFLLLGFIDLVLPNLCIIRFKINFKIISITTITIVPSISLLYSTINKKSKKMTLINLQKKA